MLTAASMVGRMFKEPLGVKRTGTVCRMEDISDHGRPYFVVFLDTLVLVLVLVIL